MASVVYPKAKEQFLQGGINLSTADVRAVFVDAADYTYNAAHDFLDDVAAGSRVGVSGALTTKTFTNGVFDADDITVSSVSGDQFEAVILYVHTGSDATARLIAYIDSGSGLPFTPSGGNITITWDNGANKIFAL